MENNSETTENLNELDLLNDKFLRKCAEFDNYKRRVQKEKEDLVLNTKTEMLSAVLDMDSDITIAMKSMDKVDEGLLLIVQKLEKFLKNQGLKEIQTNSYNEDIHEVISVINGKETKIVDVLSKGYTLNDKIVRYPKIILSKHG